MVCTCNRIFEAGHPLEAHHHELDTKQRQGRNEVVPGVDGSGDTQAKAKLSCVEIEEVAIALGPTSMPAVGAICAL
jgi:hypothetical protein